jgi:tRNA(His) guanylyltransferase
MSSKDKMGDRLKKYEQHEAGRKLIPLLPICVRIDGKRFSRFTKGLARPFDKRFSDLMVNTTIHLVKETNACIGYTQSDEISLIYNNENTLSDPYLGGKIQKLCSILASETTAYFMFHLRDFLPEKGHALARFDCRVWNVPNKEEAVNTLLWREFDAIRNSITMAACEYFSPKELYLKNASKMQEMLLNAGVDWESYPNYFKRGTYVQNKVFESRYSSEEIELLPERHQARLNPDIIIKRRKVERLDMPPFSAVTNRVGVIFNGEEPQLKGSP